MMATINELIKRMGFDVTQDNLKHLDYVKQIVEQDAMAVIQADTHYNGSWKKRGGVGAYFVAIRKYDRLEAAVMNSGWDVFAAIKNDDRPEGVIDDIRDLRRYLLLFEAEAINLGICPDALEKDKLVGTWAPVSDDPFDESIIEGHSSGPPSFNETTVTGNDIEIEPLVNAKYSEPQLKKAIKTASEQGFVDGLKEGASLMCDMCRKGKPFIGVPRDGTSWTHQLDDYTSMCMARPIITELHNRGLLR